MMKNKSIYDEIFDKPCSVCKEMIKKDVYDQGDCPYCKWKNNFLADENPNRVIYPNLISLNKAKKLYSEGRPFEPNLDDFVEALFFYSEVQFKYKNIYYEVILASENDEEIIKMNDFNGGNLQTFKTKEDYINNAKVEGKLLKDIWADTTDRDWLQ